MLSRLVFICLVGTLPTLRAAEPPYTVDRADIVQQVRERGVVDAAKSTPIVCMVHQFSRNSPHVIKWVVEEGTHVKKGDRIVAFDDGFIRDRLKQQKVVFDQTTARAAAAEGDLKIAVLSTRKEVRLLEALAERLDTELKRSESGATLAKRRLQNKLKQAELALQRTRLALEKNGDDTLKRQLEIEELFRDDAELELKQYDEDLNSRRKEMAASLRDAKDSLELEILRGEQKKGLAEAVLQAARVALAAEKSKLDELAEDLKNCEVHSPADGIAIYFIKHAPPAIIAVGEPVREGQHILRIVDLSRMVVALKVHESQVSFLRPGQAARVRIDAFPDRTVNGKVATVAVASDIVSGWDLGKERRYAVRLALDETALSLKPGMSAEVTIQIGTVKNALRVPVNAVARSGRKTVCLVQTETGVREAPVTIGINDGKYVEIKDGLKEGEKVQFAAKP